MEEFDAMRSGPPTVGATPRYFATSPIKFIVMSLCTFGIYELYWSYKNWRFIKDRDGSEIKPFWRAFFYPLWHYFLLTELNKTLKSKVLSIGVVRGVLAAGVFLLNFTIGLPDPYWLLSLLTILGFLPALLAMQGHESTNALQDRPKSFHPSNLIAYLLGAPLFVFVALSAIGFFPSTAVVTKEAMWDRDIEYLRDNDILGPDEEIAYFYSEGAWSIAEGGQFFSDKFVTSYSQDLYTGEMYLDYVEFSRISNIEVAWAETWLDMTIVTITTDDDYQFELWLSEEAEGDRKFVTELKQRWNRARD
jgi:hypothetical protein